jgi:type IV pilus assembly protein PilY1
MFIRRRHPHVRFALLTVLVTLASGFAVPFSPVANAATTTASGLSVLSPTPPNATQAVGPNIAVTFDDSGSMAWDYMSDNPPFNYSYPVTTTHNGHTTTTTHTEVWTDGPWYCAAVIDPAAAAGTIGAHAMNGVYYNPNIYYKPPVNSDGTSFVNADSSLTGVWNDGIIQNRPLGSQASSKTNFTNGSTRSNGKTVTTYWNCQYDGSSTSNANSKSPVSPNGGPYYYTYTGPAITTLTNGNPDATSLANLYTVANWTAQQVTNADLVIGGTTQKDDAGNTVSQYQNWANWWAYYHTRTLMARTSVSRVFGDKSLASNNSSGGFGTSIRVAWQNLNSASYVLTSDIPCKTQSDGVTCQTGSSTTLGSIISDLVDTSACTAANKASADPLATQQQGATKTPPACYRSAFFNWVFQVGANGGTPTRSAAARAGVFFSRGNGNTGATGNLEDPYWQPPASGTGNGNELQCRENFHMLVTDGLWNGNNDGPLNTALTLPTSSVVLPDGVQFPSPTSAGVTSIYKPVHDSGDSDSNSNAYASLSDIAFHYWATNLRPDLYDPTNSKLVVPYLPDTTTSVFSLSNSVSSTVQATQVNPEIYFNPANDPATWPHMSEYLIGLGVSGVLNISNNTDCTDTTTGSAQDACNLRKGLTNSNGIIGWPTPNGNGSGIAANIDDTWHAALAGRGQFFSAGNPQNLVDQLSSVLSKIIARAANPTVAAVNASVLTLGALTFNTGYSSIDWSGVFQAVTLNTDGTSGALKWDAGGNLTDPSVTDPTTRQILTAIQDSSTGKSAGAAFENDAAFDAVETSGLKTPALSTTNATQDTLKNRVDYLRGVRTMETGGYMRVRSNLLGAIIDAQPVYVSYPSSGYSNNWPSGSLEAAPAAQTYDTFVTNNINRKGTVYVAANDGMLHAFDASLACTATDSSGKCLTYGPAQSATAGLEMWAYVPRAVYGNLGTLTSKSAFSFVQTVNGSPITRDVFFAKDNKWHTILVGGLRLGGRGVYALDITDPTNVSEATAASSVLWEFDSDSTQVAAGAGDLGFTYGQPNIGRLANGQWVVLIPSGYLPDCTKDHAPTCPTSVSVNKYASGTKFSSLFVLNAETGAFIAELKTPDGTDSFGLTSPVLGDYQSDQIDDVAYAGDLEGNLWRFDLTGTDSSKWSVALAFKPDTAGAQPITVMPRLFPDPATNRFMVVFGTGEYLGSVDTPANSEPVQTVYGIRDLLDPSTQLPVTVSRSQLLQQTLTESVISNTSDPNYGVTVRSLTSNALTLTQNGWYFDLNTQNGGAASGERVVVTPAALFNSNTAIISTLIPGSSDPCNPSVLGAVMFVDATSGGASTGVSALGGVPYVGARVNNVRTSGSLPVTTVVGGGKSVLPGVTLTNKANNPGSPFSGDAPIWRRRSWSEINP